MDQSPSNSSRNRRKKKTMKIAVSLNAPIERLPVAVCWSHSNGINFGQTESVLEVEKYTPGKRAAALEAISAQTSSLASRLEASKDPFQALVTKPLVQHGAGSLVCQMDDLQFTGNSNPSITASTMLGIYDTTTRELRILPLRDVFPRMRVLHPESESKDPQTPIISSRKVISRFSSKAKLRVHDERTTSSQFVQHNTEKVIENADEGDISHLLTDQKVEETDLRIGEGIRPTPNIEAKEPEELYKWDVLLPDHVITSLLPAAKEVNDTMEAAFADWKANHTFCQYVLRLLKSLPMSASDRISKIARILFINYMFSMYKKPTKPMAEYAYFPRSVPPHVASYLIKEFTEASLTAPKLRLVTARGKHKILATLLLVALGLEGYATEITSLMADMQTTERKTLAQLAKIIGAKFVEKGDQNIGYAIILKYPWNFPKGFSNSPRKKGRR